MNRQDRPDHSERSLSRNRARIALCLSNYSRCRVHPEDIDILAGPDATGNLRVGWRFDHFAQHFVITPDGQVRALGLERYA